MLLKDNQATKIVETSRKTRILFVAIFFFFLGYVISIGVAKAIKRLDRFIDVLAYSGKKMSPDKLEEVLQTPNLLPAIILGGGSAGYVAALYLARAGYKPCLLAGRNPGGAIAKTKAVCNWPGKMLIGGGELAQSWRDQAITNGAEVKNIEAYEVDFSQWPFVIKTQDITTKEKTVFKAFACLITTGAAPNKLGVEGESEYWGRGISNCVVCDAFLVKNKTAVVVGGGDAAIDAAKTLAYSCKQVFILVRGKKLRAKDIAATHLALQPNVKFLFETQVKKIAGDDTGVTSVVVQTKDEDPYELKTDGVFLMIGSKPNTAIFKDQLEILPNGCLKLFAGQQTSVPGVFSAGDVTDALYRQAIIAAGDGCKAALQTLTFLENCGITPNLFADESKVILAKEEPKEPQQTNDDSTPETLPLENEKASPANTSNENAEIAAREINDNNNDTPAQYVPTEFLPISNAQELHEAILLAQNSGKILLLDFFGTWCNPCKILHEVLLNVIKDYHRKVIFGKVDVDIAHDLTHNYNIRGVPTLLALKCSNDEGHEIDRNVGALSKGELAKFIDNCLL